MNLDGLWPSTMSEPGRRMAVNYVPPGGSIMTIAFIGTGTMGRPMLGNLVKKGFAVSAYDVVPAALDAAVELGAARAGSPAAAADCDLVITMLPSSANVEAAYLGAGGIIEGAAAGRLCVD